MYLGDAKKLSHFFDLDIETSMTMQAMCLAEGLDCYNFSTYMQQKYPESYQEYEYSLHQEKKYVVIEALKDGVIFTGLEESMALDNLVLLRAKLSKKDRALAIINAFSHYGKPYDYNFTNYTNDRLVCTELITKSYEPDPEVGKEGITTWEVGFYMGRPAMYAFDLLETFVNRIGKPEQQLELVIYLKGEQGNFGTARTGTLEELISTL